MRPVTTTIRGWVHFEAMKYTLYASSKIPRRNLCAEATGVMLVCMPGCSYPLSVRVCVSNTHVSVHVRVVCPCVCCSGLGPGEYTGIGKTNPSSHGFSGGGAANCMITYMMIILIVLA